MLYQFIFRVRIADSEYNMVMHIHMPVSAFSDIGSRPLATV